MNWTWVHTFWALVAAAAEPAYESLQGQPWNKATALHAAAVWAVAMATLLAHSPRKAASEPSDSIPSK